jgi:membrane-associated phospholipid phosphatase
MRSSAVLMFSLTAAAPILAVAAPAPDLQPHGMMEPAASRPRLRLGATSAAMVATGALALWGAMELELARDEVAGCRWCEPGAFDGWARHALRWNATGDAGEASDLLLVGIPVCSAAAIAWLAARDGARLEIVEDLLVYAAALVVADSVTTGMKHATARLRPHAWAAGGPSVEGDLHSFFSAHTSRVFVAAAVAAQVARLRGRPGWKWVAAVGFTAAAATGWLRIAADQHWATDVLAGAAVGTAAGFGVAAAALRPDMRTSRGVRAVPGGIAVVF